MMSDERKSELVMLCLGTVTDWTIAPYSILGSSNCKLKLKVVYIRRSEASERLQDVPTPEL